MCTLCGLPTSHTTPFLEWVRLGLVLSFVTLTYAGAWLTLVAPRIETYAHTKDVNV